MIGQAISHYKVLQKIGEGGMGEVFLAEDTSLDRKVALKFLPDYLQEDEVAQKRFLREAQSAAALDHPFICHIHEVGEVEGKNFIAMEYVKGTTLQEKLLQGRVPLGETLRIGTEVAEALEEAHEKGIVHRDLKPSNIMLTPKGHAKVMDFGLAKRLPEAGGVRDDITAALTREGATLGTIAYMSPEQTRGKAADTRADIFSFGIVLYEMLTGVHPFRRETQAETSNAILNEHPTPLDRYTEDTSDLLQHTLEKMLAKEPSQRYQSVHEVWTNLSKLSEKLSAPGIALPPVKKKRSVWLGTGAVLGVLVAVVLAVYYFQPRPKPAEEAPFDSIAVLPFSSVSEDEESASLAEGIPASISSSLSRLPQLRVKPSSILRRYQGKDVDPQTVSEEQGVSAVLIGSLQRRGNTLAVTVELIDGRDNTLIWSQRYNREFGDVFTVEEDIARQVAEALLVQLTDEERESLAQTGTKNPAAYQAYSRGWYHQFRSEFSEAATWHKRAIEMDPDYQMAYHALGWDYIIPAVRQMSQAYASSARAAWERVVEIDDSTALARWCNALVLWSYEKDWKGAAREFARARELDPHLESNSWFYLMFLEWMGRREESLALIELILEQADPLSAGQQENIGWSFLWNREYDRAIEQAEKALALEPESQGAYYILSRSYEQKGMNEEAFKASLEAARLRDRSEEELAALKRAFEEEGLEGVRRQDKPTEGSRPIGKAMYFAELGEKDQAFAWLQKTWVPPLWGWEWAPSNPFLDPLRDDPRFAELLCKQNLPEEAIQRHLVLPRN